MKIEKALVLIFSVFFLIFAFSTTIVYAPYGETELIDSQTSYEEDNMIHEQHPSVLGGNNRSAYGHDFNIHATDIYRIVIVSTQIRKISTPIGEVAIYIYEVTGTWKVPTGSPLATSDIIPAENIPGSLTWVNFTFSGNQRIHLEPNTEYGLALVCVTETNDWVDLSIGIQYKFGFGLHDGNAFHHYSGAWEYDVGVNKYEDMAFEVYGQLYTPPPPPPSSRMAAIVAQFLPIAGLGLSVAFVICFFSIFAYSKDVLMSFTVSAVMATVSLGTIFLMLVVLSGMGV